MHFSLFKPLILFDELLEYLSYLIFSGFEDIRGSFDKLFLITLVELIEGNLGFTCSNYDVFLFEIIIDSFRTFQILLEKKGFSSINFDQYCWPFIEDEAHVATLISQAIKVVDQGCYCQRPSKPLYWFSKCLKITFFPDVPEMLESLNHSGHDLGPRHMGS